MIGCENIPGFSNYAITKDGRVWSISRKNTKGGWLTPIKKSGGHLSVDLCIEGKHNPRQIHRLVLKTYVGLCPKRMECRHLDGNPVNNNLDNLCWGTKKENSLDSIRHGTHVGLKIKREKSKLSKLKDWQVRLIFHTYHDGAYTQQELAEMFKVNKCTIHYIVAGKTWRHINGESKSGNI